MRGQRRSRPERAEPAQDCGDDEGQARADRPQRPADRRGACDGEAAERVVEADRPPGVVDGEVNDPCLVHPCLVPAVW